MRQAEKPFVAIFCIMIMLFIFPGCTTEPPVSPLQSAAREVVLKDPANPERWVEYGRACLLSNNLYGAELAFKKAIQLNEKYIPAYKHLGLVLVTSQRQSEAEEVYKQAVKISGNDSELRTAYGYCLIDLGKDKQALEAFRQSIALNTDPISVVSAKLGISALLRRQGDEAGAQQEYEQAVNANPEIVRIINEQKTLSSTEITSPHADTVGKQVSDNLKYGEDVTKNKPVPLPKKEEVSLEYEVSAAVAIAKTEVTSVSDVLLEVIDLADPVRIGNNTTYRIMVTNQGSAVAANIAVKAMLEPQMEYASCVGATNGSYADNTITFAPLPSLEANKRAIWEVTVKAKAAGDVRFKATMRTDRLDRGVEETEATRFYE